jgi:hypothetical protein
VNTSIGRSPEDKEEQEDHPFHHSISEMMSSKLSEKTSAASPKTAVRAGRFQRKPRHTAPAPLTAHAMAEASKEVAQEMASDKRSEGTFAASSKTADRTGRIQRKPRQSSPPDLLNLAITESTNEVASVMAKESTSSSKPISPDSPWSFEYLIGTVFSSSIETTPQRKERRPRASY